MSGFEPTFWCGRAGVLARPAAIVLATLLQCMPFLRSSAVLQASLPSWLPTASIVFRWVAGGSLVLGAMDSVSGASASVSGLTLYQNNRPSGKALTNVVTRVGATFNYRITVLNPGSDHEFDYFALIPAIPPGLNLNTNLGGSGFITGTPSQAGVYPVTLVAGNDKYPIPATLDVWIQVEPALTPPTLISQPQSVSVLSGQPTQFTVAASGTSPLAFQWFREGAVLQGATNATLTFLATTSAQQGQYWVVVSNSVGSVTSSKAVLTVQEPLTFAPVLDGWSLAGGEIGFRISGPAGVRQILWVSSNFRDWLAVRTNVVPDGTWRYSEPRDSEARFFRVLVAP